MSTYWAIAAHSANEMFYLCTCKYNVPYCQFRFSLLGFGTVTFYLIAPFLDHCLLLAFIKLRRI